MISSQLGSVVHATPGRLRLRVARAHRTPQTFREINGLIGALPGVEAIETTIETGSILIRYDPSVLDVEQLLKMGSELGWVQPPVEGSRGLAGAWPPHVDKARLAKGVAFLGVAGLGGLVGPAVGVGARLGSIVAGVAYVLVERQVGRIGKRA